MAELGNLQAVPEELQERSRGLMHDFFLWQGSADEAAIPGMPIANWASSSCAARITRLAECVVIRTSTTSTTSTPSMRPGA